ncbi:threonine synthase-like 1 [Sycon ciliatum]|uniref:threonine synthase-like 1 n=1 Tax=Sycon ciliatum TaxID=27933 RepID=UPI0031F670EA
MGFHHQHCSCAPVPLKSCRTPHGQQVFTQELFWGPTASFKDLSLQLMPQLLQYFAGKNKYAMVVATSGDTGSAALHGFGSHTSFPVVVFYPGNGGVSSCQEQQMIGLAAQHPHCRAIAVNGDFDFCQSAVKQMFSDVAWRDDLLESFGVQLNAANSINWMRLLPQIIHHAAGYLQLVNDGRIEFGEPLDLCIPSGNFGNAMAALYVKRMGIPFHRILIASNVNNVLEEFISTGMYDLTHRSLVQTMSPAIDILVSSNVERLLHLIARESRNPWHIEWARCAFFELNRTRQFSAPADLLAAISSELAPVSISDEQCCQQICDLASSEQYILDPHTAVAVAGCRDGKIPSSASRVVLVAGTAHFAKFPEDVSTASAIAEPLLSDLSGVVPHTSLQGSLAASRQAEVVECSASVDDMKRIVKSALLQQAA